MVCFIFYLPPVSEGSVITQMLLSINEWAFPWRLVADHFEPCSAVWELYHRFRWSGHISFHVMWFLTCSTSLVHCQHHFSGGNFDPPHICFVGSKQENTPFSLVFGRGGSCLYASVEPSWWPPHIFRHSLQVLRWYRWDWIFLCLGTLPHYIVSLVNSYDELLKPSGTEFYPSVCAYRSSRNAAFQYGFLAGYEIGAFFPSFLCRIRSHLRSVLQSMNSWRKFRTYRDVSSRTLNTLYWDGIMYMSWIIGERSSLSRKEALPGTSTSVIYREHGCDGCCTGEYAQHYAYWPSTEYVSLNRLHSFRHWIRSYSFSCPKHPQFLTF